MKDFLLQVANRLAASDLASAREVAKGLLPLARDLPLAAIKIPHLAETLSQPDRIPLTDHLAPLIDYLNWEDHQDWTDIPLPFRREFAYCELVGPDGAIPAETFRMGLYVQFPNSFYPLHNHAAEELYLPLSGTAHWWRDGVEDQPSPPGTLIRHAPYERHASRTTDEPLLAIWTWTGMIGPGTYLCDPTPPQT
ncbi:MAG: dimethylsulfonioproprionate lyase family protein [Pseudomonadota bacterium]